MKRHFLAVLVSGTLLCLTQSPAALAGPQDDQFLDLIQATLKNSGSAVQAIAASHDDQTRVLAGKNLCQALDQSQGDVNGVVQRQLIENPEFQQMSAAAQQAEGYYFGIVLAAAAYTYCPQYVDAIDAFTRG